ncbi:DUF5916 domain-containing protein [Gemmatimonas sp.]|uniref:carbohydrate binding family 9 domain-containing protein n=1 Tax=Gemmatimonas sp. TaxID=1962908 RepID=UPI00286B555F|nr:DUF5916 domain-containing protein [Gemmatimonas sp.]
MPTSYLFAVLLQVALPVPPASTVPASPRSTSGGLSAATSTSTNSEAGGSRHAGAVFHGRRGQLTVTTPRRDAAVVVDGRLDEPAWADAALLTGFSQFFPADGIAAQDSTEVLVWYSATELHVGIRAFAAPGSVRATLSDRDKITQDDNVQLFLGTYGDSRQAFVFAVNPFGIQSDGVLTETGAVLGGGFTSTSAKARESSDLAPDYVWKSKGQLTDFGYQVELSIPFKSLRYRAGDEQRWQLNVARTVQTSGHEETWTPALRGAASFLAQSGVLAGLRDLRRGLTVDLIPTITSSAVGTRNTSTSAWNYDGARPELGGSVRWGVTSNLTVAGTANPDFSQVEADATQFSYDPRQAVFFPERRPFFLESQEQFTTPNRLIYTRRIAQPVASGKLTGKYGGFDIGVLSALDNQDASFDQKHSPLYNILRLQRDLGSQSRVGVAYTDKIDGQRWNRVVGVDGRLVRGIYNLQGQIASSFTGNESGTLRAPLFDASASRNGRRFVARYAMNGISPDFDAQSGFIARPGIANISATHRWNFYGKPKALVELFSPELFMLGRYQYDRFVNGDGSQDRQLHLRSNARLRGGWQLGAQLLLEVFGYDPSLYSNYVMLRPGAAGRTDTVAYTGAPKIGNRDWVFSLGTPEFRRFSYSGFAVVGYDENFQEWSSSRIFSTQNTLNLRPTEQLRVAATWNYDTFDRRSDGTRVLTRNTPRIRTEYQVTRQFFVRVIGERSVVTQDSLRDDTRTEAPIHLRGVDGSLRRAAAFERTRARIDVLLSYLPSPGTVVYLGYGDALSANRPGVPERLQRTRDQFFMKLSYLFRLQ